MATHPKWCLLLLTGDIEVCIARGLPHFVGNDTFVDTSMCMADGREYQTMDVFIWGRTGGHR